MDWLGRILKRKKTNTNKKINTNQRWYAQLKPAERKILGIGRRTVEENG